MEESVVVALGEPDINIFVVQSGRLDVTSTDSQGKE